MKLPDRKVLSWAGYDWANSAFATTVMAGFFPLFFRDYWGAGTKQLTAANSLASLVVALLAPLLGAIADRGSAKKRFLLVFTALGVATTGGLYLVAQGDWPLAFALYVLAGIGFSGGLSFYDALLVEVAPEGGLDTVSALGYSLGYLGGGLLFTFNVVLFLWPSAFGLADGVEAVQVAFLSVALWWALFSLPLFLWVPEPGSGAAPGFGDAARAGWQQLWATFRHIRQLRPVFLFLLGYWFYIDGVDTIIRMAVDYGAAIGLDRKDLITALLLTQFVGFPAAIAYGALGNKLGTRKGIFLGLGVYIGVTVWSFFMSQGWEFYAMAVVVGLVQGGVQALSRSYFATLIPAEKTGEFFGFYNMLGKTAAIVGPALMYVVTALTSSPRLSILSVIVLFVCGAALLRKVKPGKT